MNERKLFSSITLQERIEKMCTLISNIAIKTQCHGYNVTYTQGKDSLSWAVRDAEMLIKEGKARTVLVGCHDESTHLFNSLLKRDCV